MTDQQEQQENENETVDATEETAIQKRPYEDVPQKTDEPMGLRPVSMEDVRDQVERVRSLMNDIMEEDEHYGDVTGQGKPSLYQPGAELLCSAFGMTPRYEVEIDHIEHPDLPFGHREVRVKCYLYARGTDVFLGEGVGSCSTLEPKYRYRKASEVTDVQVPKAFWDSGENQSDRNFDILRNAIQEAGIEVPEGTKVNTEKVEGVWFIEYETGRVENEDIAAQWNTVLKMGKKRSLVDAAKTVTGASDIFTQDLEDLPPEQVNGGAAPPRHPAAQSSGTQRSDRSGSPQTSQNRGGDSRASETLIAGKKRPEGIAPKTWKVIGDIRTKLENSEVGEDRMGTLHNVLTFIQKWPEKEFETALQFIEPYVPENADINIEEMRE